jgi:hypothetical protein
MITAPVSAVEVNKAIKHLKHSKYVGADGISHFVIKGCSYIFIPLLIYVFNVSVTIKTFLSLWKQQALQIVSDSTA